MESKFLINFILFQDSMQHCLILCKNAFAVSTVLEKTHFSESFIENFEDGPSMMKMGNNL